MDGVDVFNGSFRITGTGDGDDLSDGMLISVLKQIVQTLQISPPCQTSGGAMRARSDPMTLLSSCRSRSIDRASHTLSNFTLEWTISTQQILTRASTTCKLILKFSPWYRGECFLISPSGISSGDLNLPVKSPRPSGLCVDIRLSG